MEPPRPTSVTDVKEGPPVMTPPDACTPCPALLAPTQLPDLLTPAGPCASQPPACLDSRVDTACLPVSSLLCIADSGCSSPLRDPVPQVPSHATPASARSRALLAQWRELVPDCSDDDPCTGTQPEVSTCCLNKSSHLSEDSSPILLQSAPATVPEELNFTRTTDTILRSYARIFCPQVTSKPLNVLYDTGFSCK